MEAASFRRGGGAGELVIVKLHRPGDRRDDSVLIRAIRPVETAVADSAPATGVFGMQCRRRGYARHEKRVAAT